MKIILNHKYEDLISIENLLLAWQEFLRGKRKKHDVQIFQFNLAVIKSLKLMIQNHEQSTKPV